MRSHLLLGCLSLFFNIVTFKPHLVIINTGNNALVGVLTGVINLENLADLQLRINTLVENLRKGTIGIPLKDALIDPTVASELTSTTTTPLPLTESHKEEKNNCTQQLEALKAFATEFVINTLEGRYNKGIWEVNSLFPELNDVDSKVDSEIIERELEKTYSRLHYERLLALIVRNKNISQVVSGINGLFEKIKAAGDLNNSIVLNLASNLNELQNRTEFASLNPTEKDTFKNIVDSLPACVKNLFFEPKTFIWNVQTKKGFNYARKVDLGNVLVPFRVSRKNDAFAVENVFGFGYFCAPGNNVTMNNETWHTVYIGHPASVDTKLWNIQLAGDEFYLKNVSNTEYFVFNEIVIPKDTNNM